MLTYEQRANLAEALTYVAKAYKAAGLHDEARHARDRAMDVRASRAIPETIRVQQPGSISALGWAALAVVGIAACAALVAVAVWVME